MLSVAVSTSGMPGLLIITWVEPSNRNAPTLNYTITHMNLLTGQVEVQVTGPDVLSFVLTDLDPFTRYSVSVKACSEAGCGVTSSEVIQRTPEEGTYNNYYSPAINVCL